MKILSPSKFFTGLWGFFINCIFCSVPAIMFAQNDTLYFKHFGMQQGMSSNSVSRIIQDHLGYMWYGTREGLNKFDGYNFTVYLHNSRNVNSLSSDDITCSAVGGQGMIWIGTSGKGLNGFDIYSNKFSCYHQSANSSSLIQDSITSLFVDSSNIVWIGTASMGLDAFDPQTKIFKHFRSLENQENSLTDNHITCIGSNGKGILWIGTRYGGMNRVNTHSGAFTAFNHRNENSNSISSNNVRDIYVDPVSNTIWIATDWGLNKFEPWVNKFTAYIHNEKDLSSISSNDVTCVFKDKYGKIWAGTADKGVNVLYAESTKFLLYIHDADQLNSLSSNKISSISQGRSGMMWIATTDGGLNAFNPKSLPFNLSNPFTEHCDHNHAACIVAMIETKNHSIWYATPDDGITEISSSGEIIHTFRHDATVGTSLCSNNIVCAMEDHRGLIWIGSRDGLNTIDPQTQKVSKINFQTIEDAGAAAWNPHYSSSGHAITALLETRNSITWIGTCNGLFLFDPDKNSTVLFRTEEVPDPFTGIITSIAEDGEGVIWIGTREGLLTYRPLSKKLTWYHHDINNIHSIGSDYINSVYIDADENVWIGTEDAGLNIFNREANGFVSYAAGDGLPGNSVSSILEDNNSHIWIGTLAGICKLTFDHFALTRIRSFDETDGLPTTHFEKSACLKMNDGRMLFSCSKGIIMVNPDNLNPNTRKPPVVITDFRLFL
ncbi:MAG: hypothetical protein H0W62_13865 [Chitinophagales bacterium]|nr:hypothetical protein [Chitinophagales bacterium]